MMKRIPKKSHIKIILNPKKDTNLTVTLAQQNEYLRNQSSQEPNRKLFAKPITTTPHH
jgi:hypothetical protein